MSTQILEARAGNITPEMRELAKAEGIEISYIQEEITNGRIVITKNRLRKSSIALGIGRGLRTKVNANIGTSRDHCDIENELKKLEVSISNRADAVMDLSTGGDIRKVRRAILDNSPLPVGTVPIYQAVVETMEEHGSIAKMKAEDLFSLLEEQAKEGVDFVTLHCGVTLETLDRLREDRRIMDVVSRGGAFLIEWMIYNERENPLFERFDRVLEIAKRYDLVLSLGDGMRPGCLADATDRPQIQELIILGELASRALKEGVQVMIEGPGHVPLHQIAYNVQIEKEICKGAPFYVLGPLVTDIAPGYDHITAAIGGAIAGTAGADFLCYVTPSEHLRLPTIEDVKEGIIAARIAAHAADIAKGIKGAIEIDIEMAKRRKNLDWDGQFSLAIDPEKAKRYRKESRPYDDSVCTMCGSFCAIKTVRENLNQK